MEFNRSFSTILLGYDEQTAPVSSYNNLFNDRIHEALITSDSLSDYDQDMDFSIFDNFVDPNKISNVINPKIAFGEKKISSPSSPSSSGNNDGSFDSGLESGSEHLDENLFKSMIKSENLIERNNSSNYKLEDSLSDTVDTDFSSGDEKESIVMVSSNDLSEDENSNNNEPEDSDEDYVEVRKLPITRLRSKKTKIVSVKVQSKNCRMKINKNKKMKNCIHVWQFLRDLLQNKSDYVQWIDQKQGVFKIIKQDDTAILWGKQKDRNNRKPMDYEKMSRGIRHSRRDGFFKFINKKKSYGVKLVYQFGPKAIKHCSWLQSIIKTNDLD